MRQITTIAALVILTSVWQCAPRPVTPPSLPVAGGETRLRVRLGQGLQARVVTMPLEEYVAGSLLAEVAFDGLEPGVARRMARVQALVARTFAYARIGRRRHGGFDVCDATHCQLYRSRMDWPAPLQRLATEAVADTRGLVITHENRPIDALFHSDCGGHTSPAWTVWGGPTPPYLMGVRDPYCAATERHDWRFEIEAPSLRDVLNQDRRTRVGSRLDGIRVLEVDQAGRIVRLVLDGERTPVVRGEELRAILVARFGPPSVRSTRFQVRREGTRFVLEGNGYGHGVGLCQTGALRQARDGRRPEDILRYYYPGTTLRTLR